MVLKLCSVPDEIEAVHPAAFQETSAAYYYGISIDKFRAHVHAGRILARVEGKRRLYLKIDLDSFLQSLPIDHSAVKTRSQGPNS